MDDSVDELMTTETYKLCGKTYIYILLIIYTVSDTLQYDLQYGLQYGSDLTYYSMQSHTVFPASMTYGDAPASLRSVQTL